jgi:hypothetical protein
MVNPVGNHFQIALTDQLASGTAIREFAWFRSRHIVMVARITPDLK